MALKRKLKPVFFLVLALEIVCFVTDYFFIPRGYGFWFVYTLPMLLIWRTTPSQIFIMTVIVSILMIAGVFVTLPYGLPVVPSVINHIGGALILWIISILTISRINSHIALYESEQKYKRLAENIPEVITRVDLNCRFTYMNTYGVKILQMKQEDINGKTFGGIGMKPALEDFFNFNQLEVIKTGEGRTFTYELNDPRFGQKYFSTILVPEYENGKLVSVLGITRDITDLKMAEEDLKKSESHLKELNESLENTVRKRTEQVWALSKELIRVELRERKRLSYTLHEELQQMLFGAHLLVSQYLRDRVWERFDGKQDDMKDVQMILNKALKLTRSISIELNPPILPNQGLGASLRWLVNYMQKSYGMKIISRSEGDTESIKGEFQLMLTQMVRELLNNVVQHAGTDEAQLDVKCLNNRLEIVVIDKGKGFNSGEVFERKKDETRLGLFSIRERLNLFGGELIINSVPGQGTTCRLILPGEFCTEEIKI